ncbi:hypothetical protein [Paenibacillus nasutitermitis]|uniref:Uncharacterized protein n=1 Tax=Paenibacillus nasutitermitis TaxID=1652958 RepID=A0A917DQ36_9BACL|nr:hypothetical protein [Paenibacillus nasutitermitis]GGD55628.1 hypothetical protein GCM10010911_11690 [Paenibacillus nasutitermitis]
MAKSFMFVKASYLQLRLYLFIMLGLIASSIVANVVIYLSMGDDSNNTSVSIANMFTIFLLLAPSILSSIFFKKMMNLGASRRQYYSGLIRVYVLLAAGFAGLNLVWLKLETDYLREYGENFNILEIFHWNQFGSWGMFLYQFGAYMMLMSLLTLLFSGLRHPAGWAIWIALIAAIPIGTSVPSLRPGVADGFRALLFNNSLQEGFSLTMSFSLLFLIGGWLFTRRRTV